MASDDGHDAAERLHRLATGSSHDAEDIRTLRTYVFPKHHTLRADLDPKGERLRWWKESDGIKIFQDANNRSNENVMSEVLGFITDAFAKDDGKHIHATYNSKLTSRLVPVANYLPFFEPCLKSAETSGICIQAARCSTHFTANPDNTAMWDVCFKTGLFVLYVQRSHFSWHL